MCLTLAVYTVGGHGWVAVGAWVVAALGGLIWTGRELPARLAAGWPLAAGVVGYLLVLLPTALTGHWSWTGYNFANDTAYHLLLAEHLQKHGIAQPPSGLSTPGDTIRIYLQRGIRSGPMLRSRRWRNCCSFESRSSTRPSSVRCWGRRDGHGRALVTGLATELVDGGCRTRRRLRNLTYHYPCRGHRGDYDVLVLDAAALGSRVMDRPAPCGDNNAGHRPAGRLSAY